jgi:hypothetical protein
LWDSVPYDKAQAKQVPDNKNGVYAFVVYFRLAGHEFGYFLYVGKAERQSLLARFRQYFRERRDPKGRVLVREMLDRWADYQEFRYNSLPAATDDSVEKQLTRHSSLIAMKILMRH